MAFSVCRRAQDRAPTFRVVVDMSGSLYRGTDFTLAIYATDENGCFLNVNGTAVLSLSGADASDALDDDGVALSTITITNGVWSSTKVAIDGGSGPETGVTINCDATGYTTGTSDSFDLSEFGVVGYLYAHAIAGTYNNAFAMEDPYVWYGGTTNGLMKLNTSDFSTYTLYDWRVFTGMPYGAPDFIAVRNGYLYGEHNNDGKATCIRISDMTTSGQSANNPSPPNNYHGCCNDNYFFLPYKNVYGEINRYNAISLGGTLNMYLGGNAPLECVADSTYFYAVHFYSNSLLQLKVSDLTTNATCDMTGYTDWGYSTDSYCIAQSDDYVYVAWQKAETIVKIKKSDMTIVSVTDTSISTGNGLRRVCSIGVNNGYVYTLSTYSAHPTYEPICAKLKESDMSTVWTVDLSSYLGSYSPVPARKIYFDSTYLYGAFSSHLFKIAQ